MSARRGCREPMIISYCRGLLVLFILATSLPFAAAEDSFPFGTTLMLDAAPMRGSKRIPMLEIAENGAAAIDLWCATARAQAVVADHSISITPGNMANTQCEPERQSRDAELLSALAQVTNWRRKGDVVEFLGITPLRFRLMTN
jgi:META domain-containing protein